MGKKANITVWCETDGKIGPYPQGIHETVARFLSDSGRFGTVRTAALPRPEHGLTDAVLNDTDALLWWGHAHHHEVEDAIVEKVQKRVLAGMGLLVLHSAHASKIFQRLMGTHTGSLRWREKGERERVWNIAPSHPICEGVPEYFDIPHSETYGEYFHIPAPEELLFLSWYSGGDVFRSGCVFRRGFGNIFFFAPGHETFPIYDMPEVQRVIINAADWAAPARYPVITTGHIPSPPEAAYREA